MVADGFVWPSFHCVGDDVGVLLVLLVGAEILLGLSPLLVEPVAVLLLLTVVDDNGFADGLREVLVFLEAALEVVGVPAMEETFD